MVAHIMKQIHTMTKDGTRVKAYKTYCGNIISRQCCPSRFDRANCLKCLKHYARHSQLMLEVLAQ